MKLNKQRQKLYLDGKVGLINDGTVEQLRDVTDDRDYMGNFTYYHKNRIFPSNAPLDNVQCNPIAWFYENEMELPKKVRVDKATSGKEWYADFIGKTFDVTGELGNNDYTVLHLGNKNNNLIDKSDCTPITETNHISYKLNIDIPEWLLKAGDEIEAGRLPRSIIEHIATPCTTYTLENGTQIELTANDIDKIKKL